MNDWWLYAAAYAVLITLIAVTTRLSVKQTLLVAALPIAWPILLPIFLIRRGSKVPPPTGGSL